jgi:hypothetical protein
MPIPPPGDAAIEGTKTHKVGEVALTTDCEPVELLGTMLTCHQTDEKGEEYPIEFEVTAEQVAGATVFTEYVNEIKSAAADPLLLVEEDISTEYFEHTTGECIPVGCHSDVLLLDLCRTLHIADYKNGRIPVGALNNTQLAQYSIGAIARLSRKFRKFEHPGLHVDSWYPRRMELTIVQPNAPVGHDVETWIIDDMEAHLNKWVDHIKNRLFWHQIPGEYVMGPQCEWCQGLPVCPAVISETLMFSDRSVESMYEVTPRQLAELLTRKPHIEKLLKSLDDTATKRIATQGKQAIPGFKQVSQTKRYKNWIKEAEAGLRDLGLTPEVMFKEDTLNTPTHVLAYCKKHDLGVEKDIKKLFNLTPKTYTYIVPESDPREESEKTDDFEGHFKTKGGDADAWADLID